MERIELAREALGAARQRLTKTGDALTTADTAFVLGKFAEVLTALVDRADERDEDLRHMASVINPKGKR